MAILTIDKVKQKNDADFKMVDASDIDFDSAARTIATGAITQSDDAFWNIVDTEASAASDDLDTITVASKGPTMIMVSPANAARTVVIKHNTGNILCVGNADITLDDLHDFAFLIYDATATKWFALSDTTGSSGVSDGDKGDITVSSSGAAWAIDAGVVTLAKMADMATASLIYRKTAGTGAPEVNTLATLKTDLGLTGTNSGDQTTIVGITGTKAQFDTAVTDGNILYVGDITQYTDELAQDAVGGMVDSTLVYTDGTPLLSRAALTGDVTASAGSNSTTIANDAVTYAKMQNVSATDKLLGRSTAGSGDVEEIACTAAGRALLDDANAAAQIATLGLDADLATLVLPASTTISTFGASLVDDTTATAARTTLGANQLEHSITVESPTNAEEISIIFTNRAITITKMVAVLSNGSSTPSVTWSIRHHTDRSNAGNEVVTSGTTTTSVSTGSVVTSFNDATIPADSFIWLTTTAKSGTVPELHITFFYTID